MAKENSSNEPSSRERYLAEPQAGDEFYERGWNHYIQKEYYRAEQEFRKALALSPDHPDILYALGLTLHSIEQMPEAIHVFERVVELLKSAPPELSDRATILTRLANGHINQIKTGNWDIEDSI